MYIALILGAALIYIILRAPTRATDTPSTPSNLETTGHLMPRRPNAIMLDSPFGCHVNIVGESHYLDALRSIRKSLPDKTEGDFIFRPAIATLFPESDNKYDKKAVRVEIGGTKVGYLSKDDAKAFRKSHSQAINEGKPIDCHCKLIGGDRQRPNIGVMLQFNLEEEVRR